MDIQEIYGYSGPFRGEQYDSEPKIKIAREKALWLAEIKPHWEQYYPTNEEMDAILKMVKNLMSRRRIARSIPDERFRLSMIVSYFMSIRKIYRFDTYSEMLKYDNQIKKIITDCIID